MITGGSTTINAAAAAAPISVLESVKKVVMASVMVFKAGFCRKYSWN